MTISTTTLGGTASNVTVAKVAHGLMQMTWTPSPVSDEQAFEAIKAGIDAAPAGSKVVLNSGEFYGTNPRTSNLELVSRFFEKYPEYADRAFLSVKGGTTATALEPDSSEANLRRSVDTTLEKLRGKKRLDLFQCARVDHRVSIEETIGTLATLVKEGKFDHIGMSECSADTLRRGHAVHPISIVEIEVSPWSYEEETKKVIATAEELGIAVAAYSPLGRGFLTGSIKKPEDLKENDLRRRLDRFKDENLRHNLALVEALTTIAEKKKVTPAQLSIAWVSALGKHVLPLPGSSKASRTLENLSAGDIQLSSAEFAEIQKVIDGHEVKGHRYFGEGINAHLWG
ncbi:Aldo/keto reductase [Sistotremastrum suecicum HHB10207 ss-3]|uniref:Aldo/keto reductase n=1 Tax=Sistotremastrum suecicum HHB10207 ss-3 TaxID=1314776 RepID=A0A166ITS5_9AGAM|nr:Aldo/keto reductase [Sistotremastrum suecicum HHB10207 ss-3]